jgi:hypothetical protein
MHQINTPSSASNCTCSLKLQQKLKDYPTSGPCEVLKLMHPISMLLVEMEFLYRGGHKTKSHYPSEVCAS